MFNLINFDAEAKYNHIEKKLNEINHDIGILSQKINNIIIKLDSFEKIPILKSEDYSSDDNDTDNELIYEHQIEYFIPHGSPQFPKVPDNTPQQKNNYDDEPIVQIGI